MNFTIRGTKRVKATVILLCQLRSCVRTQCRFGAFTTVFLLSFRSFPKRICKAKKKGYACLLSGLSKKRNSGVPPPILRPGEKWFRCLGMQEEEWRRTAQERRTQTEFLGQKVHSLRLRNMVFGLDREQCLNNWYETMMLPFPGWS